MLIVKNITNMILKFFYSREWRKAKILDATCVANECQDSIDTTEELFASLADRSSGWN